MHRKTITVLLLMFSLISLNLAAVKAAETATLPAPTGTYEVGSVWRHLVDDARQETNSAAPKGPRELMVEILYPATPAAGATAEAYMPQRDVILPFFSGFITSIIETTTTLDPVAFAKFQTHVFPDAPLSNDQASYPVLIFSHGANAEVTMYTSLLQELASHGYVVVAIDHPYGAAPTVFPDGRVINPNFETDLEGVTPIWAQDQIFVLNQLESLNTKDPDGLLTGHLDLERVGVFGHSVGGAAATSTCFMDARCKAGVNLDGPVYGDILQKGLNQPFLYLMSEGRVFADPAFYAKTHGPYYEADFKGAQHLDFSDMSLWPGMEATRDAGWLGAVAPARTVEITNAYVLAFFDHILKGVDEPLLETSSKVYPEVILTSRNVTAS